MATTPYPWAVVLIGNQTRITTVRVRSGEGDVVDDHVLQQSGNDCTFTGDWNEDCQVYWCSYESTAKETVNRLLELFPHNSYAIMHAEEVYFKPVVPAQRARFTKEGLMPV